MPLEFLGVGPVGAHQSGVELVGDRNELQKVVVVSALHDDLAIPP
jgi:hypothetical protein